MTIETAALPTVATPNLSAPTHAQVRAAVAPARPQLTEAEKRELDRKNYGHRLFVASMSRSRRAAYLGD